MALNSHGSPTATFVRNADWQNPASDCAAQMARAVGAPEQLGLLDADGAAKALMGDTIFVNPMMLGYAWQQGWIPLGLDALMRAIELNDVAVPANKAAFAWGRQAAARPDAFAALIAQLRGSAGAQVIHFKPRETLEQLIARRVEFLTQYQNAAYANDYRSFVAKVQQAESALGKTQLAEAVARYLFKLMAYKDEYEVARLHADPAFIARIEAMMEGERGKDWQLHYHLAPPLSAERNERGKLVKKKYGPSMLGKFKLLAKLKGLRGGALDVFGKTEERKTERELIRQYRASIDEVLASLSAANHATAVDIARIPEHIRGYGHVKERHLKAARHRWDELMVQFRSESAAQTLTLQPPAPKAALGHER